MTRYNMGQSANNQGGPNVCLNRIPKKASQFEKQLISDINTFNNK